LPDQLLEVIRAGEVRTTWNQVLRPVAAGLALKPGAVSHRRGWLRESAGKRLAFWFQLDQRYGFDKYLGGRFVVEFLANDFIRESSVYERIWRLLKDESRRNAILLSNAAVASLPSPPWETVSALREDLRPYYIKQFELQGATPAAQEDVWFRYATRADVARWGDFLASELPNVVVECERRLADLPPKSSWLLGTVTSPHDVGIERDHGDEREQQ
jgi:hypothetical protein